MSKIAYLHLGLSKTGTTSIQDSLWKNKKYLSEMGYFYPDLPVDGFHPAGYAHHIFQSITRNYEDIAPAWQLKRNPYELEEYGFHVFNRMMDEFNSSHCDSILISSEILWGPKLSTFCQLLAKNVDQIIPIIYVRSPIHRYRSRLQQAVKAGKLIFDYENTSQKIIIAQNACSSSVKVLKYQDGLGDAEWNVVDDFWQNVLNLRGPNATNCEKINTSMSAEMFRILANISNLRYQHEIDVPIIFVSICFNILKSLNFGKKNTTKFILNDEVNKKINSLAIEDLNYLRQNHDIEFSDIDYNIKNDMKLNEKIFSSYEELIGSFEYDPKLCSVICGWLEKEIFEKFYNEISSSEKEILRKTRRSFLIERLKKYINDLDGSLFSKNFAI